MYQPSGEVLAGPVTAEGVLRLRGGKGGFGSNLRAAGKQKLTDNFDACRDLNGRRIRHKTAEQKLSDWQAQEHERELAKIAAKHLKEMKKAEERVQEVDIDIESVRGVSRATLAKVKDAVQQAVQTKGKPAHTAPSRNAPPSKRLRIDALADLSSDDDSGESGDS
jgi:hypothetical protein